MSSVTMRYFFDAKNDRFETFDKDGIELPDVEAARTQAMRALSGILHDVAGLESFGRVVVSVRGHNGPKPIMKALAFFDVSEPE